ncbi:glycosyltransferase family 4 protein [Microbacterium yannicii]|uniref:glycosyltransferase family 4 protein n=1 Tax=Microbacterium yannicii TaxID=671622 RepID=UPI0009FD9DEF
MSPTTTRARQIARTTSALLDVLPWVVLLRRIEPDLVIVNSSVTPAPLFASLLLGRKVVAYVRESFLGSSRALESILPKKVILRALRKATCTVAVSDYVSETLGGADLVCWPDPEAPSLKPSHEASSVPGRVRAVMLGSVFREKGQLDAVLAVLEARRNGADVTLDIYGSGSARSIERLRDAIEAGGGQEHIRYHGPTDDAWGVYSRADVSLVCSSEEAYGRVTAESILVGTPVVGYDLGGTREILRAGGGILTAPDPSSLAEALCDVSTDPSRLADLRRDCALRAESRYGFGDARTTMRRIIDFVEGVGPDPQNPPPLPTSEAA